MRLFTRVLLLAAFAALVVFGTCFTSSNSRKVQVDYVFGQLPETQLWLLLVVTFAVGAGSALVVVGTEVLRSSLLARRYRKQIQRLEAELHELRTLPLSTPDAARGALDAESDGMLAPSRAAPGRSV